jgi:ubiquinone/menaquinone biosynthesis C-methylase UbiE/N-acetylglutamate synthase-like GNAT family acetyltransferase
MKTSEELKDLVKEKYGAIANQAGKSNQSTGCGCGCGGSQAEIPPVAEDYSSLPGYVPDADLALGCGIPTAFARISPGDTVVDLGSGAGNDCFVARSLVGKQGRVIGLDMTAAMIAKARANVNKLGYQNVEFRLGDIDNMPIEDNTADVVVSNCVLNLVPDKAKAFAETYRILKPGGHFSISDIVLRGVLPESLRDEVTLYAGCVAGAVDKAEYLRIVEQAGFTNVTVEKERKHDIPEELLLRFLSPRQLEEYKQSSIGVFSITVYAEKPLPLSFRQATGEDTETIRMLLEGADLSTETVGTTTTEFHIAFSGDRIVGVAGLEFYGTDALLRSVAVPANLRKHRLGSRLVEWILGQAKAKGMRRVVLLTETAAEFFRKQGFTAVERASIGNAAMLNSTQFKGGCCCSAACMLKEL